VTRNSFLSSAGLHFLVLWLLIFSPWSRRGHGPVIMLDGFEYMGGGSGTGGNVGPKPQEMGQVVPQPVKVPVPEKPGPVQKAQEAEEAWKVKTAKEPPKVEKKPEVAAPPPIQRGESAQEEKTNVIRRGVAPGTKAGDGGFDFGKPGDGTTGQGKGVGIGFGDGQGPGFGGFGSYFRIVRQRVWSEWAQSAVYGSNEACIVGLTIRKSGEVYDIRIEKASGNGFYDSVALRAVRNASPLPPLPSSFPNDEQRVRIQFRLLE
jgi:TonB family protein